MLAPQPKVLLLDEPLAALDVATRRQVRAELIAHLEDFPGARVLVTHDPVEAVVLADRIVVLEDGKVSQEGTAAEIRMHPRSDYIARLVGVNLLRGTAVDHDVALPGGVLGSTSPSRRPTARCSSWSGPSRSPSTGDGRKARPATCGG